MLTFKIWFFFFFVREGFSKCQQNEICVFVEIIWSVEYKNKDSSCHFKLFWLSLNLGSYRWTPLTEIIPQEVQRFCWTLDEEFNCYSSSALQKRSSWLLKFISRRNKFICLKHQLNIWCRLNAASSCGPDVRRTFGSCSRKHSGCFSVLAAFSFFEDWLHLFISAFYFTGQENINWCWSIIDQLQCWIMNDCVPLRVLMTLCSPPEADSIFLSVRHLLFLQTNSF